MKILIVFIVALLLLAACTEEKFPAPDEFVAVDESPELIYEATAVYPPELEARGIEAVLYLRVLVDQKGKVRDAQVVKADSDEEAFKKSALDAAYKCRFKPALKNGNPVAVWVVYSVEFKLPQKTTSLNKESREEEFPVVGFDPVEKPPELLHEEPPVYPGEAKGTGQEAVVSMQVLVNKEGKVVKAIVVNSTNENRAFETAALEAAYKCTFRPATINGHPVATWMSYSVEFRFSDK